MLELKIISPSTRPSRKGPAVALWIYELARTKPGFNTTLLDLAEVNLPFLDEPNHPVLQQYQHEHTWAWSRLIDGADAFIFVTPEYNHGFPATLKNALDFVYREWNHKPVSFVSYGGLAGGTRAVQMLKPVVTALKMMPMTESVYLPFFTKHISGAGVFVPDEAISKSAEAMLHELEKWAGI